jgi:hypothetical protein
MDFVDTGFIVLTLRRRLEELYGKVEKEALKWE